MLASCAVHATAWVTSALPDLPCVLLVAWEVREGKVGVRCRLTLSVDVGGGDRRMG